MEAFEYKPLQPNEIRLLRILPGPEGSMVSCHLEHHNLENLPLYSSLSYTWGTDPARFPISLDGRLLQVTSNLHAALQEFRTSPVWARDSNIMTRYHHVMAQSNIILGNYVLSMDSMSEEEIQSIRNKIPSQEVQTKIAQAKIDTILSLWNDQSSAGRKEREELLATEEEGLTNATSSIAELWGPIPGDRDQSVPGYKNPFIWIDAICINQESLEERSAQIKLMKEIYKKSSSLTVWLGNLDSSARLAFSAMRRFADEISHSGPLGVAKTTDPFSSEEWVAIGKLFSRTWFTRSWVVQEYALGGQYSVNVDSKSAFFYCGNERMSDIISICQDALNMKEEADMPLDSDLNWTDLFKTIHSHNLLRTRSKLQALQVYCEANGAPHQGVPGKPDFHYLLWFNSRTDATDPRDKVYAVLGMADELEQSSYASYTLGDIIIDYEAPVETVYSSTIRSIVSATKSLDIISLGYKIQPSQIKSSWTPDWTRQEEGSHSSLLSEVIVKRSGMSRTARSKFDVTPNVECKAIFSADLHTLTVTGFVLSEVFECLYSSDPNSPPMPNIDLANSWVSSMLKTHHHKDDTTQGDHSSDGSHALAKLAIYHLDEEVAEERGMDLISLHLEWSNCFRILLNLENGYDPLTNSWDRGMRAMKTLADEDKKTLFYQTIELMFSNCDIFSMSDPRYVLGKARQGVKVGDVVCVLLGCSRPMVLRPVDDHYELVAEAWVPGIMYGEAMQDLNDGKWKLQDFELH